MAKVKLAANPTFKKKVVIPTPDGDLDIEFEFRHKSKDELVAFQQNSQGRADIEVVMEIACGWGYDEAAFSRDSVETLLNDRHAAAMTIVTTYFVALTQAKLGN